MADTADECNGEPVDVSHFGLRIGAIFIIMASSLLGAVLPIILSGQQKLKVPKYTFFICKYFGTGVIIATAWMHLLEPGADQLGNPCLEPILGDYPWAFAIGLMTVIVLFFVEMLVIRYTNDDHDVLEPNTMGYEKDPVLAEIPLPKRSNGHESDGLSGSNRADLEANTGSRGDGIDALPGSAEEHLAHQRDHKADGDSEGLKGQLTSIFILEFGILFHSVFVGLALGTTEEVVVLLIVLVFHQMFEGLGLGSRLALATWPKNRKWVPYVLAIGFALSTPIGVAAGVSAKPNNRNTQILTNGIFDSISAGILMYTGLIELLAHEFMFNPYMRRAPLKILLFAFACVGSGAGLMALLAKWA